MLAIQLIDRTLSSMPLRSSTWSCGNAASADGAERAALDEILEGRTVAHGGKRRSVRAPRAPRDTPRARGSVRASSPSFQIEGEHPARPQHARELRHGLVGPRTSGTPVLRTLRRRTRRRAGASPRSPRWLSAAGHDLLEDGAHPVERLDREHSTRSASRARASASRYPRRGRRRSPRRPSGQDVEHRDRASPAASARTPPRRGRSSSPARRDQPTPASRKARFSLSISRAITRRWIWFVPS